MVLAPITNHDLVPCQQFRAQKFSDDFEGVALSVLSAFINKLSLAQSVRFFRRVLVCFHSDRERSFEIVRFRVRPPALRDFLIPKRNIIHLTQRSICGLHARFLNRIDFYRKWNLHVLLQGGARESFLMYEKHESVGVLRLCPATSTPLQIGKRIDRKYAL